MTERRKPNEIPPEECPEPGWHESHRYCPCCSWTESRPEVDEVRLRATTDAMVWVEEFAKVCPQVDKGLMLGWFANAIEIGRIAGETEVSTVKAIVREAMGECGTSSTTHHKLREIVPDWDERQEGTPDE